MARQLLIPVFATWALALCQAAEKPRQEELARPVPVSDFFERTYAAYRSDFLGKPLHEGKKPTLARPSKDVHGGDFLHADPTRGIPACLCSFRCAPSERKGRPIQRCSGYLSANYRRVSSSYGASQTLWHLCAHCPCTQLRILGMSQSSLALYRLKDDARAAEAFEVVRHSPAVSRIVVRPGCLQIETKGRNGR